MNYESNKCEAGKESYQKTFEMLSIKYRKLLQDFINVYMPSIRQTSNAYFYYKATHLTTIFKVHFRL